MRKRENSGVKGEYFRTKKGEFTFLELRTKKGRQKFLPENMNFFRFESKISGTGLTTSPRSKNGLTPLVLNHLNEAVAHKDFEDNWS